MYGDFTHLNSELLRMIHLVENLILQAIESSVDKVGLYVRATFKPDLEAISSEVIMSTGRSKRNKWPELFPQIDDYIKLKKEEFV